MVLVESADKYDHICIFGHSYSLGTQRVLHGLGNVFDMSIHRAACAIALCISDFIAVDSTEAVKRSEVVFDFEFAGASAFHEVAGGIVAYHKD